LTTFLRVCRNPLAASRLTSGGAAAGARISWFELTDVDHLSAYFDGARRAADALVESDADLLLVGPQHEPLAVVGELAAEHDVRKVIEGGELSERVDRRQTTCRRLRLARQRNQRDNGREEGAKLQSQRTLHLVIVPSALWYHGIVNRANKRRQTPDQVSELTTNRLSVYLRCLNELDAAGTQTISSQALAEQFHLNAAQIRKDLAYFGEFGVRGVGYYVKELRRHLRQILGLDRHLRVAIMGAGNLGLALADYPGFRQEGFEIAALFDAANEKIGHESRSGVPIYDIKELKRVARKERLDIAVIAVPAPHAQPVVEQVIAAGVKAILNFSPGALKVPDDVKLKSVDLTVSLESLSFYLAQGEAAGG
jgi:redox-sensing transcriptional repressor